MRRRVVRGLLALLGVVAVGATGFTALLLVNLTLFYEPSPPSEADLPALPSGLRIDADPATRVEGCGSGSCYREFDVVATSGESASLIRERLPRHEACERRSLVDWRPRCVGYRVQGTRVRGYVAIGTWAD